jgi:lyso-ornithine lipid O-acyltransferase
MRAWLRIAGIVLALAICYPPHVVLTRLGRASPWPRRFLAMVSRFAGLRIGVEGRPARAPVLFVSNHASWLDILALAGLTGTAFVAKSEIAGWPVIGWLAGLNRTIFVERAARGAVHDQADALRRGLASGTPATLFAEGTTGDGRTLLPFRASLFAAVAGSAIPVQPVALVYAEPETVRWPSEEPAGRNAMRLLARPGRIDLAVRFAPPIDASSLDRKQLAAAAQQAVAERLARR